MQASEPRRQRLYPAKLLLCYAIMDGGAPPSDKGAFSTIKTGDGMTY